MSDEMNIRAMFNVPKEIELISLSSPNGTSFFGREGLRISAIFQFNDKQFTEYLSRIKDRKLWKPAPFINRVPELAKEYTDLSLEWNHLPISSRVLETENISTEILNIKNGFYYCTLCEYKTDRVPVYFKRISHLEMQDYKKEVSKNGEPIKASKYWAFTLGVLDTDNKKLYVKYHM